MREDWPLIITLQVHHGTVCFRVFLFFFNIGHENRVPFFKLMFGEKSGFLLNHSEMCVFSRLYLQVSIYE